MPRRLCLTVKKVIYHKDKCTFPVFPFLHFDRLGYVSFPLSLPPPSLSFPVSLLIYTYAFLLPRCYVSNYIGTIIAAGTYLPIGICRLLSIQKPPAGSENWCNPVFLEILSRIETFVFGDALVVRDGDFSIGDGVDIKGLSSSPSS